MCTHYVQERVCDDDTQRARMLLTSHAHCVVRIAPPALYLGTDELLQVVTRSLIQQPVSENGSDWPHPFGGTQPVLARLVLPPTCAQDAVARRLSVLRDGRQA